MLFVEWFEEFRNLFMHFHSHVCIQTYGLLQKMEGFTIYQAYGHGDSFCGHES